MGTLRRMAILLALGWGALAAEDEAAKAPEAGREGQQVADGRELPRYPRVPAPPAMFRGNPQRTGAYGTGRPGGGGGLAWLVELKLETWSRYIVLGGSVFAATEAGDLVAYDVRTGKQKWVLPTGSGVQSDLVPLDGATGRNSAVPATCHLCLLTRDRRCLAVEAATGRLRWSHTARGGLTRQPAAAEGVVAYAMADGGIAVLEARTGEVRWEAPTGRLYGGPFILDGMAWVWEAGSRRC